MELPEPFFGSTLDLHVHPLILHYVAVRKLVCEAVAWLLTCGHWGDCCWYGSFFVSQALIAGSIHSPCTRVHTIIYHAAILISLFTLYTATATASPDSSCLSSPLSS